jgi:hypothetical protein
VSGERPEIFDLIDEHVRRIAVAERVWVERRLLSGENVVAYPDILGREIRIDVPSWSKAPLKRFKLWRARRRYAKEPW